MHFLVLASLLCMTAQRTIGVIQTLPGLCTHTLTPLPLTALFPKMHTWALAFMCLGKLCTIPFFSSFQLDSSVIIKGKAADKSSSMYMKLNSSTEHSQQNLQCGVLVTILEALDAVNMGPSFCCVGRPKYLICPPSPWLSSVHHGSIPRLVGLEAAVCAISQA